MSRAVVWFRRDLRLADNPALVRACSDHDEVVPLFVVDPALIAPAGAPRLAFMADCLDALDESMGRALVYRHGDPVSEVRRLAGEVGADDIYVAKDFAPYGRRRDEQVASALRAEGKRLHGVGSPYAVDPGTVRKGDGTPYAVFTPFSKMWLQYGWSAPLEAPSQVRWHGAPAVHCDGPPPRPDVDCELPAAGEAAAHDLWQAFLAAGADGLDGYDARRNDPSVLGTSRLSPALRWGLVHPRQLLADLQPSAAHDVFRSELAWRDFYADVLFHHPHTARENLNPKMATMSLDTDAAARERFASWCEGRTGYPIVDAGMRQLVATGWMHNRVRMIVASFLVKDLHLPWQWGARHFMTHLVDGDLASNQHGWQWTAGTGTDAAPYFRVFNPVTQGERYDPTGDYVRRWVPELSELSAKEIQAPWQSKRGVPLGYLPPMVDHATERDEALARYRLVTGR